MVTVAAPRYPATERHNRETAAWVRELSDPELFNFHESVLWRQHNLREMTADDAAMFSIEVDADVEIVTAEIRRRERAKQNGWHNPYQARSDALMMLTDAIRDGVDLAALLEHEGVSVARGRTEAHSLCPLCLGTDRFVIWYPPKSHGFCRRCGTGGDVIFWAQSFWQTGFVDTVRRLAGDYLGLHDGVAA